MPIYPVGPHSGIVRSGYERSPQVALETDLSTADMIPHELRSAADTILFQKIESFCSAKVPRGVDGVITWFAGDRLLEGSAASIRQTLRTPGRRTFVAVHFPCLPELDLLAVEPRCLCAGPIQEYWNPKIRLARTPSSSPAAEAVLKGINKPWAQLVSAFLAEQAKPGAGVEALARMQKDDRLPHPMAALILRNLAVLLIRQKQLAQAEQLLETGLKAYPGYAELSYVAAVLCFYQQKPAKAFPFLQQARTAKRDFLGSGGENSYRANWLVGLLANRVGDGRVAFDRFYDSMVSQPVFAPAVNELLNLRLPPWLVEKRQWDFCRLVRREPQFLEPVFGYLLLHRAFAAARHIAETMPLAEETRTDLRQKLEIAKRPFEAHASTTPGKPGVLVSGSFFEHSGFARVNRELGVALVQSADFDACLEPVGHAALLSQMVPRGDLLVPALLRHPRDLDLTIRHGWPPDFRRPSRGKLAVIVPWEYGTVPRLWVRQIEQNVDELWAPSTFVRDVFVRSGVDPGRVSILPYGVDTAIFRAEGPLSRPQGCRKFMFLFVGGAIRRKGVDLLLQAYKEAFGPSDDVTLVISAGVNPAYAHNSLTGAISEFVNNVRLPHLQLLCEHVGDEALAGLYRACDVFVLPYRGEGFGMPILEAMACGKPVITNAQGPSQDYCSPDTAYLISSREALVQEDPPPLGEMTGAFTCFEPDVGELARTMLHVYQHPAEAERRGRAAGKLIRQQFNWARISELYLNRIQRVVGRDDRC